MGIPGPLAFGSPPLGFRFGVFFFAGGVIPNPLDILFQRVSGLSSTVSTTAIEEGGQNLYTQDMTKAIPCWVCLPMNPL